METKTSMAQKSYDIVVVGGGLAGALSGLALARLGFRLAIIDPQPIEAMLDQSYDGRTTALAYACVRLLERLDLWADMKSEAEPIRDILVTDGHRDRSGEFAGVAGLDMHFDSRQLDGEEALGWIIENRIMRREIYRALEREHRVELISGRKQTGFDPGKGRARLTLDNGDTIETLLVVAADGRYSPLRSAAGIKVHKWGYPQSGIVTVVTHDRPHKGVAQELFLPSGPFAILPMTENRASLVWTEKSDAARVYMALDDEKFRDAIASRFGEYLGHVDLQGPRWSYPLAFHLSHEFISKRLVLIGDAARAIHPIAGQGFNLGLKDIAALYDVLAEAQSVGLDIGQLATLEKYQQWRRYDSTTLALGTDVLNRLFSNNIAPIRHARRLGLGAVNAIAPLRKMFMRQAGADLGALPSLLQR
ncbi:MAG: UbiH/UbiF/VisC/COQ6 family ubiquinone biosynthesis hydroxylase [Pseudomonadota bacterium]